MAYNAKPLVKRRPRILNVNIASVHDVGIERLQHVKNWHKKMLGSLSSNEANAADSVRHSHTIALIDKEIRLG